MQQLCQKDPVEGVLVAFSKKTVAYFVNHASKTPLAVVVEPYLCERITLVILVSQEENEIW